MKEHDLNWSVSFEITVDGVEESFDDLDAATQDYIIDMINEGYFSGTTGGAGLKYETEDEEEEE